MGPRTYRNGKLQWSEKLVKMAWQGVLYNVHFKVWEKNIFMSKVNGRCISYRDTNHDLVLEEARILLFRLLNPLCFMKVNGTYPSWNTKIFIMQFLLCVKNFSLSLQDSWVKPGNMVKSLLRKMKEFFPHEEYFQITLFASLNDST
jgi:hypothetical protein